MKKTLLIIMIIALLMLSSCKTGETQVEYVPVELNVQELIQPVLRMRPEEVRLIDAPESLSDIMQNSVSFQFAYEEWKGYAELLESFYKNLEGEQT